MSLENIIKDDYGQPIRITFIDTDTNRPANISGYTTSQLMIFTDPTEQDITVTGSFYTDGSDGIIQYTIHDGLFSSLGFWQVRGRVLGASSRLSTVLYSFEIINGS